MEIINCEQGSFEWHQARLGIITASEMKSVLTKGRGGAPSLVRQAYMHKLIGELITGDPADSFAGWQTERGHALEPEAREIYASTVDLEVTQIGFIRANNVGGSPDALVGEPGLAEIKTRIPHLQVKLLLENEVPEEHKAQIQTNLLVSKREWLDFVSYCPKMPLFIKRVERDEKYISMIEFEVAAFYHEMGEAMKRVKELTR